MMTGDDEPTLDTDRPDLVVRGADGDPIPDGTRMIEKESFERVLEGIRMSAEAASRMARMEEKEHLEYWLGWVRRLDGIQKLVIQRSGAAVIFKETPTSWGGDAGDWSDTRKVFREGLRQAAGGARQMATCHRGELFWSTTASHLEAITAKLNQVSHQTVINARRQDALWVPDHIATAENNARRR